MNREPAGMSEGVKFGIALGAIVLVGIPVLFVAMSCVIGMLHRRALSEAESKEPPIGPPVAQVDLERERAKRERRRDDAMEANAKKKPDNIQKIDAPQHDKPQPPRFKPEDFTFDKGASDPEAGAKAARAAGERLKAKAEAEAEQATVGQAKREASAAGKLKLARQIPEPERRKRWLQELVSEYAGTKAAGEAELELKTLEK